MPVTIKSGTARYALGSNEAQKILAAHNVKASNKPQNPANLATPSESAAPEPHLKEGIVPFIDKLSITLTIPKADYADIHAAVYTAINDKSVFQAAKKAKHFAIAQLIAIPGTAERALFYFHSKSGEPPHARLEFNPSKLGPAGMDHLHAILTTVFDDGWRYVLQHGRITRLDIAVDLPDARMHHFLLLPSKGLNVSHFKQDGKLKTAYLGKATGNQTAIYSKSFEQKLKGKTIIPSTVRLERRLRLPKIKSLTQLENLDNVFADMQLVKPMPSAPSGYGQWVWHLFLDSVAVRGLPSALARLPEKERTKFRKHLKDQAIGWWDPEAIWAHWPAVVSELRLRS